MLQHSSPWEAVDRSFGRQGGDSRARPVAEASVFCVRVETQDGKIATKKHELEKDMHEAKA